MKVHANNKSKKPSKQIEEMIDLKSLTIQQLYDRAEH
jgi:hypothetical protein